MQTVFTREELIERNRVLIELDVEGARKMMPPDVPMSDMGLIVGMHKTRLHVTSLPRAIRQESLDWLRINGFKDLHGAPLPKELPL
jgi:hypothetical protein